MTQTPLQIQSYDTLFNKALYILLPSIPDHIDTEAESSVSMESDQTSLSISSTEKTFLYQNFNDCLLPTLLAEINQCSPISPQPSLITEASLNQKQPSFAKPLNFTQHLQRFNMEVPKYKSIKSENSQKNEEEKTEINYKGKKKENDTNIEFILFRKYPKKKKTSIVNRNKKDLNKKGKKKEFEEREGDWFCYKCKNVNFSFRTYCNRCNFTKFDSEVMYEQTAQKLFTNI